MEQYGGVHFVPIWGCTLKIINLILSTIETLYPNVLLKVSLKCIIYDGDKVLIIYHSENAFIIFL